MQTMIVGCHMNFPSPVTKFHTISQTLSPLEHDILYYMDDL